jgi:hypothetical protein
MSSGPFSQPTAKLTIASVDEPGIQVPAQYNPKELEVSQSVPWKKPDAANQTGTQKGSGASAGDDPIALEFTGAEGRTMTVELLFDGYEEGGGGRVVNVTAQVALLEQLARVRNPKSSDEKLRRPHQCVVSWGGRGLPSFQCVIESLTTKYTMFSSDGEPLRATCTVKLKEAHAVEKKAGG